MRESEIIIAKYYRGFRVSSRIWKMLHKQLYFIWKDVKHLSLAWNNEEFQVRIFTECATETSFWWAKRMIRIMKIISQWMWFE